MLKRLSKTTAILIAVVSMIYAVPASAATAVKTKDGIIKSAVSYNGSFVYEGHKADEDVDSTFINYGENDVAIKEAKDYLFKFDEKYDNKYIIANNSRDYKLDLSSGTIDTNDIQDTEKELKAKLQEEFKETDRYKNDYKPAVKRIDKESFGNPWYKYYTGKYTGFTDESGNYIDASYLANVSAISYNGRLINMENYDQEYSELKVKFMDTNAVAQDDSYIYAVTKISIAGDEAPTDDTLTFLQKISKKGVKTDDDFYIPESVDSYEITNKFKCDAAESAYDLLNGDGKVIVNSGNIYVIKRISSNKIQVSRLKLNNEQAELNNNPGITYNIKLVEKDCDAVHSISPTSTFAIDVNNNIWGLNDGNIFKIDGLNAADVYQCDSSFNKLGVYDDNNLVAWNEDSGKYSSVVNGK